LGALEPESCLRREWPQASRTGAEGETNRSSGEFSEIPHARDYCFDACDGKEELTEGGREGRRRERRQEGEGESEEKGRGEQEERERERERDHH
jgi:hypothetical protein